MAAQDVLPSRVCPAKKLLRPQARPHAMENSKRRPMAERLVSQCDQLWWWSSSARSAMATGLELRARTSANVCRKRKTGWRVSEPCQTRRTAGGTIYRLDHV